MFLMHLCVSTKYQESALTCRARRFFGIDVRPRSAAPYLIDDRRTGNNFPGLKGEVPDTPAHHSLLLQIIITSGIIKHFETKVDSSYVHYRTSRQLSGCNICWDHGISCVCPRLFTHHTTIQVDNLSISAYTE